MSDGGRLARRDGLTLLELLVSIVIFAFAILAGSRFVLEFVHQVSVSEVRAQATQFALEELERVKLLRYDEIVDQASAPVPEAPGYTRSVTVRIVGDEETSPYSYRVVTVTVQPPGELQPVRVTSGVAQ